MTTRATKINVIKKIRLVLFAAVCLVFINSQIRVYTPDIMQIVDNFLNIFTVPGFDSSADMAGILNNLR